MRKYNVQPKQMEVSLSLKCKDVKVERWRILLNGKYWRRNCIEKTQIINEVKRVIKSKNKHIWHEQIVNLQFDNDGIQWKLCRVFNLDLIFFWNRFIKNEALTHRKSINEALLQNLRNDQIVSLETKKYASLIWSIFNEKQANRPQELWGLLDWILSYVDNTAILYYFEKEGKTSFR